MDWACFNEIIETAYYIAVILLTIIIAKTGVLSYRDQRKQSAKLIVRVNENEDGIQSIVDDGFPVYIEMYNMGDQAMQDISIVFTNIDKSFVHKGQVEFIAPKEIFKYPIGFSRKGLITWFLDPNDSTWETENYNQRKKGLYEYIVEDNRVTVVCNDMHRIGKR